jgi:hypothetical protein
MPKATRLTSLIQMGIKAVVVTTLIATAIWTSMTSTPVFRTDTFIK